MRGNFKEGQELLGTYVINWRERAGASEGRIGLLGRVNPYLKKVLSEGPAFFTVACVNVLSYHIDVTGSCNFSRFLFNSSFVTVVSLFSSCSSSSAAKIFPELAQMYSDPRLPQKKRATREAVTTCYRPFAARFLSREEKLQENPLGPM